MAEPNQSLNGHAHAVPLVAVLEEICRRLGHAELLMTGLAQGDGSLAAADCKSIRNAVSGNVGELALVIQEMRRPGSTKFAPPPVKLTPKAEEKIKVFDPKTWKATPAANALLAGLTMAEEAKGKEPGELTADDFR